MKQRLKYRCWNCERVFSLFLEIDEKPDILSECPYCNVDVFIELEPYRDKLQIVFRNRSSADSEHLAGDAFPEIIPTQKPNADESE